MPSLDESVGTAQERKKKQHPSPRAVKVPLVQGIQKQVMEANDVRQG